MTESSNYLLTRHVASNIFNKIIKERSFLEVALNDKQYLLLSDLDKKFTRNLLTSTFRYKFKIDYIIDQLVSKIPNNKVQAILSLAIAEIISMKTPHYAVVNSYVNLAKEYDCFKYKGLINAVLKKACKNYTLLLESYNYENNWLFKLWVDDYGYNNAIKICQSLESKSPLDIICYSHESIKGLNEGLGVSLQSNHLRLAKDISIPDINNHIKDEFWVQGLSSYLSVLMMANRIKSSKVLDLCSAPGGKAFSLNLLGASTVKAFDIDAERLKVMSNNLLRLGFIVDKQNDQIFIKNKQQIFLEQSDLLELSSKDFSNQDLIFLDVPCLATGTIRKHPEVMYLKSLSKLDKLVLLQKKMLNKVALLMDKGSTLLYANCSLQKREGEDLIKDFVSQNKGFSLNQIYKGNILGFEEMISEDKFLRILPFHLEKHRGMEGFFAVCITKH